MTRSIESWQLDQIIVWHWFSGLTGFPPRGKPAYDHERIESFFTQ
jgi:hypothetical protein